MFTFCNNVCYNFSMKKIGIIGIGLIGGSLFKDLRKNYDVIAVSASQNGEKIFKDYNVLK